MFVHQISSYALWGSEFCLSSHHIQLSKDIINLLTFKSKHSNVLFKILQIKSTKQSYNICTLPVGQVTSRSLTGRQCRHLHSVRGQAKVEGFTKQTGGKKNKSTLISVKMQTESQNAEDVAPGTARPDSFLMHFEHQTSLGFLSGCKKRKVML